MKDKLRILIPIHSLDPGGVERVALGLAMQWDRAGHDVRIVLGRSASSHLTSTPVLNYWQLTPPFPVAACETPWMIHCLHSYLLEHPTDVLFLPGNTYAVVGAAMHLMLGEQAPPMVLKVSNALRRPDMPRLLQYGYGSWLRAQGRMFDRLVALSEPMAREVRETTLANTRQVAVIANPILSRRRLDDLARMERRGASVWGMHYLTAGRLVAQKNHGLMLRAFARAARPGDTLTIAGEGPERAAITRLAGELGIAEQVRMPGHLATIDPLLAEADAFVLSSDYEGLPGVVVEALASGLPVLSTDCCVSMACLLDSGRTGLLVPTGDEAAFADGLTRLRELPGDPARARDVAARYEIEGAATRYIDLMDRLRRESERSRRRMLDERVWLPSSAWQRPL